jgi:hypothetical protein
MVKVIWHDSKPSDPMYSEGYQSYSPHWGRPFLRSRKSSPSATVGHPTAHDRGPGKRTRPAQQTDSVKSIVMAETARTSRG